MTAAAEQSTLNAVQLEHRRQASLWVVLHTLSSAPLQPHLPTCPCPDRLPRSRRRDAIHATMAHPQAGQLIRARFERQLAAVGVPQVGEPGAPHRCGLAGWGMGPAREVTKLQWLGWQVVF